MGDSPGLAPSASCVVTLKADGVQMQAGMHAPPNYLDLASLLLLSGTSARRLPILMPVIKAVAARTGVEVAELEQRAKRFRFNGKIVEAPPPSHRPAAAPVAGEHGPLDRPFDLDRDVVVSVRTPIVFRLVDGRFEILDHSGALVAALEAEEVHALDSLIEAVRPRDLAAHLAGRSGAEAFDRERTAALLGRLDAARLLEVSTPERDDGRPAERATVDRNAIIRDLFDRHATAQDVAEEDRVAETGRRRTRVVPVAFDNGAPAGIGMVVAHAKAFEGGRLEEHYEFRTDWVWDPRRLDRLTAEPAVYLFSNYLWSHERCIAVSAAVKERSPGSITIHGGPDTPKYEQDAIAYFATHPHVDITVRGEGEVSAAATLAALVDVIGAGSDPTQPLDLSVLEGIEGICYRDGDRVVRNPDRPRVADVDALPSPFLTGLFDVFAEVPELFVTLETNRGCPYSCTFCDWGSATNSRIRQFDLDRVFAEIDWCAEHGVRSISVADANFGMLKRDVDIARKVAEVRGRTGAPRSFGVSFAKNTVKHLTTIITELASAGIMSQGVLSLQTMDEVTLDVIHRSNIRTERYDDLANEMRRSNLPLMVELMMGLPGQTVQSFAEDLQQCIDREVPARINHTTLLANSPMNDPEYRVEHAITTTEPVGPGNHPVVVSTSSFTPADYQEMSTLRLAMMMYENWGVLRQVSRFVRQEHGTREIDFYRWVRERVEADPGRWPSMHLLVTLGPAMMTAPYSWAVALAELRELLVGDLGLADDSALDAILRAQLALLPASGRRFPETVELAHDVVAWQRSIIAAKGGEHRLDWAEVVPRLGEHGPGALTVDDPEGITRTLMGVHGEMTIVGVNWELDSPLSRARISMLQLVDWSAVAVMGQKRSRVDIPVVPVATS